MKLTSFKIALLDKSVSQYTLWVWERVLAPRGSSITKAQLKRRRTTPSDPKNPKKNYGIFHMQPRPGISTSLSTTDLCLPSAVWQWSVVGYYRICQLEPRNGTEYSLLCIFLCLTVWICLKMGSDNMVLMRLLQIGAKDLTVYTDHPVLAQGRILWNIALRECTVKYCPPREGTTENYYWVFTYLGGQYRNLEYILKYKPCLFLIRIICGRVCLRQCRRAELSAAACYQ